MRVSGVTTARPNSGTAVGLSQPGLRSSLLLLFWWNQTQWCGRVILSCFCANELRVFGAPIGHLFYTSFSDLQAAWLLLLLFCGATRAYF